MTGQARVATAVHPAPRRGLFLGVRESAEGDPIPVGFGPWSPPAQRFRSQCRPDRRHGLRATVRQQIDGDGSV
jgi:hypothetical protein